MAAIDHATASKYILTVTYFVEPSKLPEFYAEIKQVLDIAHELPENLSCDVFESTREPGKVTIIEAWAAEQKVIQEKMTAKIDFEAYQARLKPLMMRERILDVAVRKAEFYSHRQ